jgi:hypothetical protein
MTTMKIRGKTKNAICQISIGATQIVAKTLNRLRRVVGVRDVLAPKGSPRLNVDQARSGQTRRKLGGAGRNVRPALGT